MSAGRPAAERLEWADAAKGASVVLVVLGHVNFLHVIELDWPGAARGQVLWNAFGQLLQPLRMPLFFAVSGFFAVRALQRPWSAVLRPRVVGNLYLHVLWLVLWALVGLGIAAAAGTGLVRATLGMVEPADAPVLAAVAAVGGVGPWFFYALALYFVLAKVTARLPRPLVLAAAAAVAVASVGQLLPAPRETLQIQQNAVWFLAAAAYPGAVRRLTARPRPVLAAALALVFVAVSLVRWRLDPGVAGTALSEVPLRLLAVVTGFLVAVAVVHLLPRAAAPWVRLGRRTLPVYVLHPVVLFVLHPPLSAAGDRAGAALPAPVTTAAGLLYTPLVTALVVLAALAVHSAALRAGARWLFALPGTARPRVVQLPPDAPAPVPPGAGVPPARSGTAPAVAPADGGGEPGRP